MHAIKHESVRGDDECRLCVHKLQIETILIEIFHAAIAVIVVAAAVISARDK